MSDQPVSDQPVLDQPARDPSPPAGEPPVAAPNPEPSTPSTTQQTLPLAEAPPVSANPPLETPTEAVPLAAQKNVHVEDTEPVRGNQAWNAVNATDGAAERPPVAPKPRKPTARRKRKAVTLRNLDEEEEEAIREGIDTAGSDAGGDFVPPQAKARGKRKVAEASILDGERSTQSATKKKRQTKRARPISMALVEERDVGERGVRAGDAQTNEEGRGSGSHQVIENADGHTADSRPSPHPKATRKRKRQTTSQPDGESNEQQLKRRGRQPRAPTPSDAEDDVIDENDVFMGDLARRDVRRGKLSQREKKMRTIDWDEVKQRQKEKEAEQMNSRALQEKMLREEQEREDAARTVQEQVRYEIVDGQTRIVQGSGQVDHERLAEARFTETVVEEDDFTNRINARSFMRNNKRYPEEFLLPGQGKRWDVRSTADFYDALRMFGTDFGMMTSLFEGVSRRSLKLKFTREERKNPDIIKDILQQKDTRLKNWDEFLKASGKENDEYDRVEEIKRELLEAEEEGRKRIQEAKDEYEEEMRQKRLAGFASDEEEGGDKGAAKKKGKKAKDKQVAIQDEEGVEVLEVDENDGWGEE